MKIRTREILCKSAIGKCGFPGGGLAINPYVGCAHNCVYCYARFIKRFTGHTEKWGSFVDVKTNIVDVLKKQMQSTKYQKERIYLGTVTDPYQPVEKKYQLTRGLLQVLVNYKNPVEILTKSDLVLRDLDILKKFKDLGINFTITTLDENWKKHIEPNSPSIKERLKAIKELTKQGLSVYAMIGPYWPIFTNPKALYKELKKVGISHIFTESFNTVGGNWTGVEEVLLKYYPEKLPEMKEILFNKEKFNDFYNNTEKKLNQLSKIYNLPITIYFGQGHAAKFKKN